MFLNFHVLYDELSNYTPIAVAKDDYSLTLDHVRLVIDAVDFDQNSCSIYIINSDLFAELDDNISGFHFLVIDADIHNLPDTRGASVLFLTTSLTLSLLSEEVFGIFRKYHLWEHRILDFMLTNNPSDEMLQEIVNTGAEMFKNPIAVFDISSSLLYRAGSIPPEIKDSIWEEVLSTGRYHIEDLDVKYQNDIYNFFRSDQYPLLLHSYNSNYNEMFAQTGLFYHSEPFGSIGMASINQDISKGQLSLLHYFKQRLEAAFAISFKSQTNTSLPTYFLEALLRDDYIEPRIIDYHLNHRGWKTQGNYCLLTLSFSDAAPVSAMQQKTLMHIFSDLLPAHIVLTYENNILYLFNSSAENVLTYSRRKRFLELLKKHHLHGNISSDFFNFYHLRYAYIQTKSLMQIHHDENDDKVLSFFDDNYSELLLSFFKQHTSSKSLCNLRLLELSNNGTLTDDMLKLLETYLLSGCNQLVTSKKFFIHRNTLSYRLEKLEGLLQLNFRSLTDQQVHILLMTCLILRDKS